MNPVNHKTTLNTATFLVLLVLFSPVSGFSRDTAAREGVSSQKYPMSQYEKGNIDTVIIEHARECQTVMFGEIHDSVIQGSSPPIADSSYVISLLPELRGIGYEYLALEVDRNAPDETHSADMLKFLADYGKGVGKNENNYPYAKPGWIALARHALDLGFQLRLIGAPTRGIGGNALRDRRMFEKLREEIFNKEETAKVLVYIGADHILGSGAPVDRPSSPKRSRTLGALLDDYTGGRNFTVYMGYPSDTPEDCDLFISNFIWQTR